jgi:hypothetical protein
VGDAELVPGAFVVLPGRPEWGTGQVQSAIGAKVTVNFEHAGKVVLDLRHARLAAAGPPQPAGRRTGPQSP